MTRRPIIAAVLMLAVAACSGDDDASTTTLNISTTSVSTSTSVEPTSTTVVPSTTATSTTTTTTSSSQTTTTPTSTSTSAPSPTTVESDINWIDVVEVLGQRRQDLYAQPDLDRIPEICGADTPCAEQLQVQLADLVDKGWRVVDGDPYTVLDATVEGFDGDSLETSLVVTVIALVERPDNAGRIVDESGETVAAVESETMPGVNTENRSILARSGPDDDPWRIVSQDRIREVPE